jgi:hypothetical protein
MVWERSPAQGVPGKGSTISIPACCNMQAKRPLEFIGGVITCNPDWGIHVVNKCTSPNQTPSIVTSQIRDNMYYYLWYILYGSHENERPIHGLGTFCSHPNINDICKITFYVVMPSIMLFSDTGRDSAVGIATGYGLDDREVGFRVSVE